MHNHSIVVGTGQIYVDDQPCPFPICPICGGPTVRDCIDCGDLLLFKCADFLFCDGEIWYDDEAE